MVVVLLRMAVLFMLPVVVTPLIVILLLLVVVLWLRRRLVWRLGPRRATPFILLVIVGVIFVEVLVLLVFVSLLLVRRLIEEAVFLWLLLFVRWCCVLLLLLVIVLMIVVGALCEVVVAVPVQLGCSIDLELLRVRVETVIRVWIVRRLFPGVTNVLFLLVVAVVRVITTSPVLFVLSAVLSVEGSSQLLGVVNLIGFSLIIAVFVSWSSCSRTACLADTCLATV